MIDGKSQSVELKFRSNILTSVEINQQINYGEQLWRHRIDVDDETIFSKEWYFQYHGQGGDGPSPFPEGIDVEDYSRDDPFVYDVRVRKDEVNEIETSINTEEKTMFQSLRVFSMSEVPVEGPEGSSIETKYSSTYLDHFVDFNREGGVFFDFMTENDSRVVECKDECEENFSVGDWEVEC